MIVTRHISLDNDCIDKIQPYIEKHKGNFSAAIRDIIDQAGNLKPIRNSLALDMALFKWFMAETSNILIPDEIINKLIETRLINSMGDLEDYVNIRFQELGWNIDLSLRYDNNSTPVDVIAEIKGTPQEIILVARLVAQFLVRNSLENTPLEIKSVNNFNGCIRIELSRSNRKNASESVIRFFGRMDRAFKTLSNRPEFWNAIINRHQLSNYNMITVHRNYFEDICAGKIPMGEITIENLAKKPIHEIPLKEMIYLIKDVYETSRVVDRVEIDKDNLILYHNFRNKETIEKLKKSLFSLLEANGHVYDSKSTANMIVMMHRPDIGQKINQIIDNLKINNSRLDQELILFISFLKQLKDHPDIPLSFTSLGRRIGKSLMLEYENENNIKTWNLEVFRNAFGTIDSKLHRESEWIMEKENLLYTINKCNLATEDNGFDSYICYTARETFKGALNYAFGNRVELEVRKLLTHGDNFCEVLIRIP